jgi:hypothetical protein
MSLELVLKAHFVYKHFTHNGKEISCNSFSVTRNQGTCAAKINFVPILKSALNKKKAN